MPTLNQRTQSLAEMVSAASEGFESEPLKICRAVTFRGLKFRKTSLGGVQAVTRFPNGYGASVVRHRGSYGYASGKYELAVLKWTGRAAFDLTYDTPITDDVLGWLSEADVTRALKSIRDLPEAAQ